MDKPPPTPLAAREAFCEAVEQFSNWYDDREPTVDYAEGDITITAACHLVETCQILLPHSCRDTLQFCDINLETPTYAAAAIALLARIKTRSSESGRGPAVNGATT